MKIKLYSTAPNGHYRAGQLITNAGIEIETDGLTQLQLDAINDDPRLVRPETWAEAYASAVVPPAQTAKKSAKA